MVLSTPPQIEEKNLVNSSNLRNEKQKRDENELSIT